MVIVVAQSPAMIPGFHFTNTNCGAEALRCELGSLAPGAIRALDLESNSFHNNTAYTVSLTITATTSDVDYVPANNGRAPAGRCTAHREPALRHPGWHDWGRVFHRHGGVGTAVGRQCADPAALPRSFSDGQRARPGIRALVLSRLAASCRLHRGEPRAARRCAGGADAAGRGHTPSRGCVAAAELRSGGVGVPAPAAASVAAITLVNLSFRSR